MTADNWKNKAYVNGKWVEAANGAKFAVTSEYWAVRG